MMTKIKILVLAFMLPVFMAGCSSSSGSSGTLILDQSGFVVQNDSDLYVVSVTNGLSYNFTLEVFSGDADLIVCTDINCFGTLDLHVFVSDNFGTATEALTIPFGYSGVAYIYVDGYLSSDYRLTVYEL